jgi:hypothetical protein
MKRTRHFVQLASFLLIATTACVSQAQIPQLRTPAARVVDIIELD